MTNRPPFQSKREHYARNLSEGAELVAGPAFLTGPNGREPAVVVRRGANVRFVIPANEALRLATEIADALQGDQA